MDIRAYQVEALRTDVSAVSGKDGSDALVVSMLGLAGEAGQLLGEYKKHRMTERHIGYLRTGCARSWAICCGISPVSRANLILILMIPLDSI